MQQLTSLHPARYRGGFHSAASLASTQAGMKFAVAHNILALGHPQLTPYFTAFDKVSVHRDKTLRVDLK